MAHQTRSERSVEPEMTILSGASCDDQTPPLWPVSVRIHLPVCEDQTFKVVSSLPDTIRLECGLNCRQVITCSSWPLSCKTFLSSRCLRANSPDGSLRLSNEFALEPFEPGVGAEDGG